MSAKKVQFSLIVKTLIHNTELSVSTLNLTISVVTVSKYFLRNIVLKNSWPIEFSHNTMLAMLAFLLLKFENNEMQLSVTSILFQSTRTNANVHQNYSAGNHFQFIFFRSCTKIPTLPTLCIMGNLTCIHNITLKPP